jgi:hypothetical protein
MIYEVKVDTPIVRCFMFIWLGVRMYLLSVVGMLSEARMSSRVLDFCLSSYLCVFLETPYIGPKACGSLSTIPCYSGTILMVS